MSKLTRRDFLKASAASFGTLVVSSALTGCHGDDEKPLVIQTFEQVEAASFSHGVASGDPMQDKVILWTRVSPTDTSLTEAGVAWEVAMDSAFTNVVGEGSTTAIVASDFTVKIDMQGLEAGTMYYYRFASLGVMSPTGQAKTLPINNVSKVTLAVVSCSNYPAGHFNVYSEVAKRDDLDAILHLGDYIYEFGDGGFGTENSEAIGRALPSDNNAEIVSLNDYRKRYALYRTDAGLQAAHQKAAFIAVWDDHEVANNGWKDGAENHDDSEGDFHVRKMAALQAYFEWMPIRPAFAGDTQTIYRQFNFGELVSLYMLDTRYVGRDKGLEYADFTDPATGVFDAASFQVAMADPSRTMLGAQQLQWLQGSMSLSSAKWQVLGQQVMMGKMNLPAEILPFLATGGPEVVPLLSALSNIKKRMKLNDPTVTAQERARVETVAPYELDAWDGYFVEREVVLGTAMALQKNLVVLTGDTHNGWANNLKDVNGNKAAVEFAAPSVSSAGLSQLLNISDGLVEPFEDIIKLLVDDLKYFNAKEHGFMTVTFTEDNAISDWIYVDNTDSTDYSIKGDRHHALRMRAGFPELTWV
jgi:alkaline phosphatase D